MIAIATPLFLGSAACRTALRLLALHEESLGIPILVAGFVDDLHIRLESSPERRRALIGFAFFERCIEAAVGGVDESFIASAFFGASFVEPFDFPGFAASFLRLMIEPVEYKMTGFFQVGVSGSRFTLWVL